MSQVHAGWRAPSEWLGCVKRTSFRTAPLIRFLRCPECVFTGRGPREPVPTVSRVALVLHLAVIPLLASPLLARVPFYRPRTSQQCTDATPGASGPAGECAQVAPVPAAAAQLQPAGCV